MTLLLIELLILEALPVCVQVFRMTSKCEVCRCFILYNIILELYSNVDFALFECHHLKLT